MKVMYVSVKTEASKSIMHMVKDNGVIEFKEHNPRGVNFKVDYGFYTPAKNHKQRARGHHQNAVNYSGKKRSFR